MVSDEAKLRVLQIANLSNEAGQFSSPITYMGFIMTLLHNVNIGEIDLVELDEMWKKAQTMFNEVAE
jgi:hypothetical protein